MPPTTRSATQARTNERSHGRNSKVKEPGSAPAARKRKAEAAPEEPSTPHSNRTQKRARTSKPQKLEASDLEPIIINRAPVLELWGACVSHFLHPELPWTTCLSIGSTISSITAISKGRSIGTISQPDPDEHKKKRKRATEGGDADEEIKVMGFPVRLKGEVVIFKGKPKPGNEESLAKRFGGEENVERTRRVTESALRHSWKGREADLEKEAFSMYERFRPDVPKGKGGWGRKGVLSLGKIEHVVQRD
ncbi:hypothetical protein B0T16DRAFT_214666 [Cercophora newfieldiana]|uniref:Uncharacterized protein n=1 Tax=Cercophora newfieldiana TaxID=92897 RepID=A0AA40CJQ9_9PEZI|nr:hypothetical protein B0T16DRAFT_214666 [Cercophora newfieldiana]